MCIALGTISWAALCKNVLTTLTDKVAIEGKVIQRAECRPMGDASYMNLKRYVVQYIFQKEKFYSAVTFRRKHLTEIFCWFQ